MANSETSLGDARAKLDELQKLAQELYDRSEDFPALNRNVKRILASVVMLQINLENAS